MLIPMVKTNKMALIALGAILLVLTMGINIAARIMVKKKIKVQSGAKSQ
jgi:ABC-type phosphate transport system permease subunit